MKYLRAQNFAAPSIIPPTNIINYDEDMTIRTNNIMTDPRICRGNTHAKATLTEDQRRNRHVYEREQASRRKLLERRSERVSFDYRIFESFVLCLF
jgi:hypothetical protein